MKENWVLNPDNTVVHPKRFTLLLVPCEEAMLAPKKMAAYKEEDSGTNLVLFFC